MYPFPSADTLLGASRKPGTWMSFVGNCAECGRVCQDGKGLFCANFSVARGYYSPCRKAWCGKYYRTPAGLAFPIRTPKDEEGFEPIVEGDQNHFKHASDGANGVCPFQCDLCHFRNIQDRNPLPITRPRDKVAMDCIRRANLGRNLGVRTKHHDGELVTSEKDGGVRRLPWFFPHCSSRGTFSS
jgi:hypothetical protein